MHPIVAFAISEARISLPSSDDPLTPTANLIERVPDERGVAYFRHSSYSRKCRAHHASVQISDERAVPLQPDRVQ